MTRSRSMAKSCRMDGGCCCAPQPNPPSPPRQLVRVIEAEPVHDPLANRDTTRIDWEPEQAYPPSST